MLESPPFAINLKARMVLCSDIYALAVLSEAPILLERYLWLTMPVSELLRSPIVICSADM